MPKKPIAVVLILVLLAAGALYLNRERFARRPIQITHRLHRFGGRFDDSGGVAPLMFEFDRLVTLTSLKVVVAAEYATNKYAHPLWQLESDSHSNPTRGILYGMAVPGMQPSVKGAVAAPLVPGPTYRLLLQSGSLKAEHDFDLSFVAR